MIRFILNDQTVTAEQSAGSTVLDYVRYYKKLSGTKIGCREGDCGACIFLVGGLENDQLVYRSMTSCLMPLGNADGKHIVTVEGITLKGLSPVQQAMVDTNGTQCGFCTPGFIMSFTGFILNRNTKNYDEAIAAIDGNICRCTGYKSIERAAKIISEKIAARPIENTVSWLAENGFIPVYFIEIEKRLTELKSSISILPPTNEPAIMLLGGGTDLIVQRALLVKKTNVQLLLNAEELKKIYLEKEQCHVGASVTVTEFAESSVIQTIFPDLEKYIKLLSSTPIRNMATLAGNIVNASPIGDMSIFFLALDAELVLNKNNVKRQVKLKQFYTGYKKIDKEQDERIEKIIFTPPKDISLFSFEKVSKRTHLDIASVNSACQIQLNKKGSIETIHLSAGGVAPYPKYLSNTCTFLKEKEITPQTIKQAIEILNKEIAPISDARGTAAYKQLLLQQLFLAHLIKFFGPELVKKLLLC